MNAGLAVRLSAWTAVGGAVAAALAWTPSSAQVPPEVSDMRLVGINELQSRSAYQPTIQKQGNRYIAYIGHHGHTREVPKPVNPMTGQPEFNGTSILDVTDPAHPKYLKHLPGQEGGTEAGGAQMTRVCPGTNLPRADRTSSICCARSARPVTRPGTSPTRPIRCCSPRSAATIATRTRAGGNATPASPTWSPACPAGASSA